MIKKLKLKLTATLLLGTLFSSAAYAAEVVETVLIQRGVWKVEKYTYAPEPTSNSCSANSQAGQQYVNLYGSAQNTLQVYITDERWKLGEKPVSFVVTAGDSKWRFDGEASGPDISAYLPSRTKALNFMIDVATGHNLVVTTTKGKQLAKFGLKGSTAAMIMFAECWASIQAPSVAASNSGNGADPFSD